VEEAQPTGFMQTQVFVSSSIALAPFIAASLRSDASSLSTASASSALTGGGSTADGNTTTTAVSVWIAIPSTSMRASPLHEAAEVTGEGHSSDPILIPLPIEPGKTPEELGLTPAPAARDGLGGVIQNLLKAYEKKNFQGFINEIIKSLDRPDATRSPPPQPDLPHATEHPETGGVNGDTDACRIDHPGPDAPAAMALALGAMVWPAAWSHCLHATGTTSWRRRAWFRARSRHSKLDPDASSTEETKP
jgi:hypothetical protein